MSRVDDLRAFADDVERGMQTLRGVPLNWPERLRAIADRLDVDADYGHRMDALAEERLIEATRARALADRLFNACIVLYGAAKELRFGPGEHNDAALHARVIDRAEVDLGPDLLAQVQAVLGERQT